MFGCGCGSVLDSLFGSRQGNSGTQEAVVIPCKYCGTLFPQTETFCPHCGARRTA